MSVLKRKADAETGSDSFLRPTILTTVHLNSQLNLMTEKVNGR